MSEPGDHLPEREAMAAEYVLGTLPLAERTAAEAMIARDAGFRALVEAWRDRLAPLDDGYEEIPPPPELLGRIDRRLFPVAARPRRWGWLGGALAGLAAAVLAVIVLSTVLQAPAVTATLTGAGQPLIVATRFDAGSGELTAERTAGPAAEAGKDYELWLIPEGQAPVSLGLVRDGALTVRVAALPAGTTLAVTLEASGGSASGAPQGPLLVATVIGS